MDPFTVLQLRGQLMDAGGEYADYRRRMPVSGRDDTGENAGGPVPTPRAGGRKMSARDFRGPRDLNRSRRVGLARTVCGACGAVKDQGFCQHDEHFYHGDGTETNWLRETTGPIAPNETSSDTGWR